MDRQKIAELKAIYKEGDRVEILFMDTPQAPEPGSKGTIKYVDDIGQIHVNWDTGGSLAINPDEDIFRLI